MSKDKIAEFETWFESLCDGKDNRDMDAFEKRAEQAGVGKEGIISVLYRAFCAGADANK